MKELWKEIEGFEGSYEVSNIGRVRSLDRNIKVLSKGQFFIRNVRGTILKSKVDRYGYISIELNNGAPNYYTVHRLVAKAFVVGYFPGAHVNHKNLDKTCNKDFNLEWVTNLENQRHANRAGVRSGTKNGMSKLDDSKVKEIKALLSKGLNTVQIGKIFDVSNVTVSLIRRGKIWKHV